MVDIDGGRFIELERNWWGAIVKSFESSDVRLVIMLFKAFVEWSSYALSRRRSFSAIGFQACFFNVAFVLRRAAVRSEGLTGMHSPYALCSGSRVKGGTHGLIALDLILFFTFGFERAGAVHVRGFQG